MRRTALSSVTVAALIAVAGSAHAGVFGIDWLDMSNELGSNTPVGAGGAVASGSTFNLPGYGPVRVDYIGTLNRTRNVNTLATNGSVNPPPDHYTWAGPVDTLSAVNFAPSGSSPLSYNVRFTFLGGAMPAGQLAFGTLGLGRARLAGTGSDEISSIQCGSDGTYLGDWDLGLNFAPHQFTGGAGGFTMINGQPSSGASGDPAFNADFGVVRIDQAVSVLSLNVVHIGQDGFGMTVGRVTPAPGAAALLGLAGLGACRRRRTT